jgi:hypothetical protein
MEDRLTHGEFRKMFGGFQAVIVQFEENNPQGSLVYLLFEYVEAKPSKVICAC